MKVKQNPKFWVVTRTGIGGKFSNWDISSDDLCDNKGFPSLCWDLLLLPVVAMGQKVNAPNGTQIEI